MKYLIVGDLQLKSSNQDKALQLFKQIEELGLPTIHLGDMLDKRGLVEANCLNLLFKYFSTSKLQHYIVNGNHDLLSLQSTETALEPLKALRNVVVYDKPGQLGKLLFVPYYRNPSTFIDTINEWLPRMPSEPILICHQGVKEFTLGSGYTEDEAVNLGDLRAFNKVIAGHYHTPNQMENVIYLGSPFSHSFGESNENKRIGILDYDTGDLQYIETNFSKHITIELDLFSNVFLVYNPSDYNRVILKGNREQLDAFDKSKHVGVKFIEELVQEVVQYQLKETLTPEDLYRHWMKEIKKETDEDLYNLGLDIIKVTK